MLMIINAIVPFLCFAAMMCLAHKYKIGFIIFMVVDVCFFYIGTSTGQWGIVITGMVFFFTNLYSYRKWGKTD